jgi:hypothetical protein
MENKISNYVMIFGSLLCLFMIGITPVVYGQTDQLPWYSNGKPVPDTENVKSKNGFGAQVWLTPNDIVDEWNKPEAPKIIITKRAKRNTPVYITILFASPSVNEKGLSDISGDILIRQPDGKVYADLKNVDIWENRAAPPKGNIQLAEKTVAIVIENKDLLGTYSIDVLVRDDLKQVTIPLHYEFIAEE